MAGFRDLKGEVFGRLTALEKHAHNDKFNKVRWVCECECGATVLVTGEKLRSGNTKSCGCLMREVSSKNGINNRKHGMTKSPEYKTWWGMKDRCCNPDNPSYKDYGARGIEVCNEWMISFELFFKELGPRPSPAHSLDRIDNSKGYQPGNCRWATGVEQANNKRNNDLHLFKGELLSLSRISAMTGIPQPTLWSRLNRMKLTIEEAVEWKAYNQTRNLK